MGGCRVLVRSVVTGMVSIVILILARSVKMSSISFGGRSVVLIQLVLATLLLLCMEETMVKGQARAH